MPRDAQMATVLAEAKTFNYPMGFERGLWQRESGWSLQVPKGSVFGADRNGGCSYKVDIENWIACCKYLTVA